jgi:putative endopeptidase
MKKSTLLTVTALAASAVIIISCGKKEEKTSFKAIDPANMDTTIRPQDDFYTYANGAWMKNNPIPASESRWGSFSALQEETNSRIKKVLEDAAANTNAKKGSNEQKVGDFYASGMDSMAVEKSGLSALQPELDKISAVKTKDDVMGIVALHQTYGTSPVFSFYVYQDLKNSSQYISYCDQGGLTLPDRDYYTNADPRSQNIRKEYVAHVERMFKLMGDDEATAKKNAQTVMSMETRLAKASMTRVELRDPYASYNKKTLAEASAAASNINWKKHFDDLGAKNVNDFIMGQPKFFAEVNKMLTDVSIEDWKIYLRWQLVSSYASELNDAFVQENFAFNGKVLNGTKELKPRWKRVLANVENGLGEALGQVYVEKYFSEDAKKRCLDMVNNMQGVYRERIQKLDWMSDSTKQQAVAKLDVFIKKIGYPDKFKDYSKLDINRDSYVMNCIHGNQFAYNEMVNKLGKPIDKTEWGMTPQTINAYYNPTINEIVFPAAILQFPFFDPSVDDAVNYGGIGAVIGHEMTHGFDDQGAQFDKDGNLKNWWSEEDAKRFKEKTTMVVDQYNAYTVLDTVHVNGELTQGENIADLGGLAIAYEAFKRTEQGKSEEKIDGFTPDQRFFLGWAQVWRQNIRNENLMQRIMTDPHSPGIYRANGPLTNMPEFYAAFGVKEGDKMWKPEAQRAKVW